ncbi:hypothetical protein [Virgibacillus ndiopensis]|uniref:hypothetical protein n=1 Tax=Virgibacillus ndiopensis TaxID=2004408 RepID=UPI000C07ABF5|nr:hypothetical protein [Virgibacillus ndiopensis]
MIINLVLYIVGLFILYLIIQAAVRSGIDNSEVGKIIREKYGLNINIKNDKKSFLDGDLDKD